VSETGGSTPVLEAWIGRLMELTFVSGSRTEYADGRFEEVNGRGIVLRAQGHGEHRRDPVQAVGRRHPAFRVPDG
jgi:hypothetical protein